MAKQGAGFFGRHNNVYIYVPNLIGYVRVAFALYAFAISMTSPLQCIVFYFFSFVCDELDGRFARMLGQTSTLGAVLDMVTDRLATTGLLLLLAVLYPWALLPSVALIFLDIFSHWFQMYSTLLVGSASHKDTKSASWLVRMYYRHRLFMGFCCVCCEVLYLALYGLAFPVLRDMAGVALPPAVAGVREQLVGALPGLAPFLGTGAARLPLLVVLAAAAIPGVVVKQICNFAQLRASAALLVAHDTRPKSC